MFSVKSLEDCGRRHNEASERSKRLAVEVKPLEGHGHGGGALAGGTPAKRGSLRAEFEFREALGLLAK